MDLTERVRHFDGGVGVAREVALAQKVVDVVGPGGEVARAAEAGESIHHRHGAPPIYDGAAT